MQAMPRAAHQVNGANGTQAAAPALSFRGIAMTYPDGTDALADVSFDVAPGEFVAVVGPSGCGKSTLLKLASGLLEPTGGTVSVTAGDNLGYVFQDATLLPWRTVRRNVELLLELNGVRKAERAATAQQTIDLVGLTGFEDHYPKRLSGGMKMRASLARALTRNPPVFLFDEPFGALDEITRERLNDELLNLFGTARFAGLFITHSIQEACFLASRVLVMSARPGRIVAEFTVPYEYPRTPEVRYEPEFAELNGRISAALRSAS
jgi:NitT/TauT family transport system ATP-binding protein